MKLGVSFPEQWKEKSKKDNIPLSDMLYGYIVEDLMLRISNSSFRDYLWLTNEKALGKTAYKKKSKESLEFLYIETPKHFAKQGIAAGDTLKKEVIDVLIQEIFSCDVKGIEKNSSWSYKQDEKETGILLSLNCTFLEMQVPVSIYIEPVQFQAQQPKKRTLQPLFEEKKVCEYLSYSKESVLSEALYEIISKMELISDMENYDIVNEILSTQSVSGRHIIEDFKTLAEKSPKVISMKRLEQISTYKEYGYMKKKWQQYCRKQEKEDVSWEVLMDRLIAFLAPLWKALCEDEIFFDDWMPELGRFLG